MKFYTISYNYGYAADCGRDEHIDHSVSSI